MLNLKEPLPFFQEYIYPEDWAQTVALSFGNELPPAEFKDIEIRTSHRYEVILKPAMENFSLRKVGKGEAEEIVIWWIGRVNTLMSMVNPYSSASNGQREAAIKEIKDIRRQSLEFKPEGYELLWVDRFELLLQNLDQISDGRLYKHGNRYYLYGQSENEIEGWLNKSQSMAKYCKEIHNETKLNPDFNKWCKLVGSEKLEIF